MGDDYRRQDLGGASGPTAFAGPTHRTIATKYVRAANITANGIDVTDVLEMDFGQRSVRYFSFKSATSCLAEAAGSPKQVGRAAIWQGEIPDGCFQNTVIRVRPHAVVPEFALLVFRRMAEVVPLGKWPRGVADGSSS